VAVLPCDGGCRVMTAAVVWPLRCDGPRRAMAAALAYANDRPSGQRPIARTPKAADREFRAPAAWPALAVPRTITYTARHPRAGSRLPAFPNNNAAPRKQRCQKGLNP